MPGAAHDRGSWAMTTTPPLRMNRTPAEPSEFPPVSTTAMARGPKTRAMDSKSGQESGREVLGQRSENELQRFQTAERGGDRHGVNNTIRHVFLRTHVGPFPRPRS